MTTDTAAEQAVSTYLQNQYGGVFEPYYFILNPKSGVYNAGGYIAKAGSSTVLHLVLKATVDAQGNATVTIIEETATDNLPLGPNYLPGDVGLPVAAFGVRPMKSNYNGPFADITRVSDGATVTFVYKNGAIDIESLAVFGAGTRLRVVKWYNQISDSPIVATAETADNGPVIDPRQTINGVPSLVFDSGGLDNEAGTSGAARWLDVTGLSVPNSNFGAYHVSRVFNDVGGANYFEMNLDGQGGSDTAIGSGPYFSGNGSPTSTPQPVTPQVVSTRSIPKADGGSATLTVTYHGVRSGLQVQQATAASAQFITYDKLLLGNASSTVVNGANGGASFDSFLLYSPAPTDEQHEQIVAALTNQANLLASTAIVGVNGVTCGDSWMQSWHSQSGLIWPYRIAEALKGAARLTNFGFFQAQTAINDFANIVQAYDPDAKVNFIHFDDGINDLDGETGPNIFYDVVFARQKQLVEMGRAAGFKVMFNTSFFEGGNSGGGKMTTEVSNHNKMLRANAIGADYICDIASDPIAGPIGVIQGNSANSSDGSHLRQAGYDRVAANIIIPAINALIAGKPWVVQGTPNCIGLDNPDGYYAADGTMTIAGYYLGAAPSGITAKLAGADAVVSGFTANANRWSAKIVAGADGVKQLTVTSISDTTCVATSDPFNVQTIANKPAGKVNTVVLTTGQDWNVPDGTVNVTKLEAWGAGGRGYDGGGGGGAWAARTSTASLGELAPGDTLTVACGGIGDPSQFGGDSTVTFNGTVLVKAAGGEGAYTPRIQQAGGEPNAVAKGGQASACVGDISYSGGDGGVGDDTSYFWTGGGGSASPNGAGENGHASTQTNPAGDGYGGSSPGAGAGGAPGLAGASNVDGGGGSGQCAPSTIGPDSASGGFPGGGSGGASNSNGDPGAGQIRITYTTAS